MAKIANKYLISFGAISLSVVMALTSQRAKAAGTDSSSWGSEGVQSEGTRMNKTEERATSLYDQGVKASDDNNFEEALTLFEQALKKDKSNPDILNMLAHTQLKLGKIDESLENYKQALKLRPRFAEAREYLGEAYIHAALREIKTLKSYGASAKDELEDLTEEFKKAAAEL